MTRYVAIINTPGYMPDDDDFPDFDTPREAWEYMLDELERTEGAWVPSDASDPDGPQERSEIALTIEEIIRDAPEFTGTVYGPTSGYEGDHDLGLAYSVEDLLELDD